MAARAAALGRKARTAPPITSPVQKHIDMTEALEIPNWHDCDWMPLNTDPAANSRPSSPLVENSADARPLLRFAEVVKEYATEGGRVRALDGLTLDVSAGTFVALMGRSGCGKSTLLNMAGAMDFPSGGEVLVDGGASAGLSDVELTRLRREKVGFIFQSFQLLQTLSVVENVELPLLLANAPQTRSRALEQLEAVGLRDFAARMPHQLSGGQMQRVAIARALVAGPASCLPTNRRAISTRPPATPSLNCCKRSAGNARQRS